jgi:hypothetical protein
MRETTIQQQEWTESRLASEADNGFKGILQRNLPIASQLNV